MSSSARVRVLGIDPGSRKSGWGLVDVELKTRRILHVDNGVLMLPSSAELPVRLVELSHGVHRVLETYRPDVCAVEDVFVNKGARSALTLGQARGAVVATVAMCGIPVATHNSAQVKARVTGRGRASKEQVAEMVRVLLGLPEHPFEDAADALAVAVCHALEQMSPAELPAPTPRRRSGRSSFKELARAQGKL